VFDAGTGFLRPRLADGSWLDPFDPHAWGRAYVEGSAWQYRFAVPHDPHGLADAFGGQEKLLAAWDRLFHEPPTFRSGGYKGEIHEMTEMVAQEFGQYAHSNQPVHGYAWLPARLGDPDRTDRAVRRILDELYTPDRFTGDEDNGEQGAWYVLASLGRYAACPGDGQWTRTRPLFELEDDRPLTGGSSS
jgi:putative alpha-1,2-mannosidase